jgi:hypothetical protein
MANLRTKLNYAISITGTRHIEGAGLPHTVYVMFHVGKDDSDHTLRNCERDFRNIISEHFEKNVGCHFDRYTQTATLSFRNEDDAAMFITMI